MNSRKQVSNRYDDTLEGEEQIRQIVSFQVQEIVDGDRRGVLEQEDVSERRRTEDEEETLRMTQKVSNQYNLDNNNQMEWCESPTMSRRDWTKKCSGAGVYEGWGDEDQMTCSCAWLGLRWNQVQACVVIGWDGGQTDPWHIYTHTHTYIYIYIHIYIYTHTHTYSTLLMGNY